MHKYLCTYKYVCMHTFLNACIHVLCIHSCSRNICSSAHIFMFVCIHACKHVYMQTFMQTYVHAHVRINKWVYNINGCTYFWHDCFKECIQLCMPHLFIYYANQCKQTLIRIHLCMHIL